ncbi:MAG: MBL fold metallo-hydrolase [Alistipes sp.]|nr:MBL fold metallo-hydrolase [Alistipes sp.]MBQ8779549.1 MBL fold metallo-hydrolase [Alistipes sp.]MBR6662231.1 MBL fold metallo-hydrolase [Alistipes sp.]
MKIARLIFNPLQENTYVVWDESLEAVVIDAGNMSERENATLEQFLSERGLTPVYALNTHGHFDHLMGVEFLRQRYGAKFAVSSKDKFLVENAAQSAELFGIRAGDMPEKIDVDLEGMQSISFGQSELQIISTPGHTPGHVAFYEPNAKILFTGDTLFRESIGRTDLPGGDYSWIMKSILEKIMPLGDEVKVYPGHGETTDIGHESMYNPFVVEVMNQEVNYRN